MNTLNATEPPNSVVIGAGFGSGYAAALDRWLRATLSSLTNYALESMSGKASRQANFRLEFKLLFKPVPYPASHFCADTLMYIPRSVTGR